MKREAFWTSKVDSDRSFPRQLWRSIDALMGRGRVPLSEHIDVAEFQRHFDAKVADVRALTASAPPPSFSSVPFGCTFAEFQLLTVNDITAAIRLLPDKHCVSNPIPTSLLKDCVDVLVPSQWSCITNLCGQALCQQCSSSLYNATVEEV